MQKHNGIQFRVEWPILMQIFYNWNTKNLYCLSLENFKHAKSVEQQVSVISSSDERILDVTPNPMLPTKRPHCPKINSSSDEKESRKYERSLYFITFLLF